MIFKGEEISMSELAKRTGVPYQTIQYRYDKQGLRDDELIVGGVRKHKTLQYNGEEIEVTHDLKDRLRSRNISLKTVQERLDAGWDYDLATNLNKSYVTIDNTICHQMKVNKHFYHIPYDELPDLKEDNITPAHIRSGLTAGNDIYDIVPIGTVVYINGVKQTGYPDLFDEMEDEYIEKKVQAYKAERQREKKAHLYKVPQQHSESKYAKYLWESYTFKCREVAR